MIIAQFKPDSVKDVYSGQLYSAALPSSVTLEPNAKAGGRAPDYHMLAKGRQIGPGWKRAGRENGTPFVSVHIDDPALPAPIDATLSQPGKLVWIRQRLRRARNEPTPR